jgi:F-type H+-transporting ATPase subunit gamma
MLLPIVREELEELASEGATDPITPSSLLEYQFEPSPQVVLQHMLERFIEVQLYQIMLEATASEHAARMMTMRNASDSANELIDGFTMEYNQARQSIITRDLAELSAARLALEG